MNTAKGCLIPVGGAEDKGPTNRRTPAGKRFDFFEEGILRRIIRIVEQIDCPKIELITTASSIPDQVEKTYRAAFQQLGCSDLEHLFITDRHQVDTPEHLERIHKCNCIIFTGGDQLRLSTILGGTQLLALIQHHYQTRPIVVAGTSAGAMAMGATMIYDGNAARAHLKGEIKFTTGFGFINNMIIDTHFEKRGRFNRLAQAVAIQPGMLGVGLAEDTGVIIAQHGQMEVIGSGIVTLVNGATINHTNLADISDRDPISVDNLTVHILAAGDKYDLNSHQPQHGISLT